MPSPIKFHAESGHRVSGERADAYGRVDVHVDGSWEGFAHTNSTPGVGGLVAGAGQRGTVIFYDAAGKNLGQKELWNFNINAGGDRQDNVGGGVNDISATWVVAATKMGFVITDGEHHVDCLGSLDALRQAAQVIIAIVSAAG